jgi:hypothetical protein
MTRTPNPVMTEQREVTIGDVRYTRRTWANGVVKHYRANRRQACLVTLDPIRNSKVIARIEDALKPRAAERWAALVAKCEAHTDKNALYATMDAEGNAADTLTEQGRADAINDPHCADEKAEIAFGSLCWTTIFQENADVRAFFEAAGYRW